MTARAFAAAIAAKIEADWEVEVETVHPHQDSPYEVVAVLAWPGEIATSATNAKVPELCLTCGGSSRVAPPYGGEGADAACPDCPSIAKLLAIAATVMGAEVVAGCWVRLPGIGASHSFATDLLTYLRAVQP